ncbi:MAG: hypothetical protein SGCHY_004596, partial [Lobulomycetales sp.]
MKVALAFLLLQTSIALPVNESNTAGPSVLRNSARTTADDTQPARRVTFGEDSEQTYYPAVAAAHSLQAPSNQIDYTDDDSVARFQPDLANNGLGVDAMRAAPPHLPTRRQSVEADEDNGDEESIEADEEGSHSLDSGSREVRFQPDLANNGHGGQAVRAAPHLPSRQQSMEVDEDVSIEADEDDSEGSHTLDSNSREVRFQPDLANNGLGGQA